MLDLMEKNPLISSIATRINKCCIIMFTCKCSRPFFQFITRLQHYKTLYQYPIIQITLENIFLHQHFLEGPIFIWQ